MDKSLYHPDDDIAALATPFQESAIAVFRLSGPQTFEKTASIFSRPSILRKAPGHSSVYGQIVNPKDGRAVDDVLVTVFRKPRSYTGQDSVEISCHGSLPVIRNLLELFLQNGFRQASPGEFTFRAYLNGKLDLTQAEAVQELIASRSGQAGELALNRLHGVISEAVNDIKDRIQFIASWLALHLDYPDDEIEAPPFNVSEINELIGAFDNLLATYKTGRLYKDGVKLVLAGRTNAGKSSLFNLILKEERSIVSDVHGTTRDFLESEVAVSGVPVTLFDTAGIRGTDNSVEAEGIKRTKKLMDEADLILYLVDATEGLSKDDLDIQSQNDSRIIFLWNKADLNAEAPPEGFIAVSALKGSGFTELENAIRRILFKEAQPAESGPVLDSQRQKQLLESSRKAVLAFQKGWDDSLPFDLLAEDLQEALHHLELLTGEISPDDILNTMFSRFCVGK